MRTYTKAQKQAIAARKKEYHLNVTKPRIAEIRAALIEGRTPRLVIFPENPPRRIRKQTTMRDMRFSSERKTPLPDHPPIRTIWRSAPLEIAV